VSRGSVIHLDVDPIAGRGCGLYGLAEPDRHVGEPRDEPLGARRSDAAVGDRVPHRVRKAAEPVRDGDEPGQPHRADVRGRVHELRVPAEDAVVLAAVQPVDDRRPDRDLDGRSGFVHERGGLQSALPASDHQHRPSGEDAEVAVIAGMRDQRRREVREARRPEGERCDPSGDDDPAGTYAFAVRQPKLEPSGDGFDLFDRLDDDVRRHAPLHPRAVVDEVVERDRLARPVSGVRAVDVQRMGPAIVGDGGRRPVRPEQHALRHGSPERHGVAVHRHVDTGVPEMRRGAQAVRPGAEDHAVHDPHALSPQSRTAPRGRSGASQLMHGPLWWPIGAGRTTDERGRAGHAFA
jgi:hypothetical protein